MLAASDLYDLPRQVNFSNSQIEAQEEKMVQIPMSELDLL